MASLIPFILSASIVAGQLIKYPQGTQGGITALDLTILFLNLLAIFSIKAKFKKPPLFVKSAFIFVIVAALSLIFTPLKLDTLQYLNSFAYILRFSSYILFGWLVVSGALPTVTQNINKILIFSGVGIGILGLLQFIFIPDLIFLASNGWDPHYLRTVSTFLDPNFTGVFLSLTLILLAVKGKEILRPRIFQVLFLLVYLGIVTTFSRSAYIALLTSFLLLALLKKSFLLLILTIVLGLGLWLGFKIYTHVIAVPNNINRQQSAKYRLNSWEQGWQIFTKSPILGSGFNSYRFALSQYHLTESDITKSRGASANDSSLLFVLATTGILGLAAYIFFIASLIRKPLQNPVLVTGLVGIICSSFFINSLFYPFILIWIILMICKPLKSP